LKCKPLDDLLGGGIESKMITKIYGEAGSGKTNLCLQASRECANNGKKVAYIDSEGASLERLGQICKDYSYEKILKNILFFSPSSLGDQEKMVKNAINVQDLDLLIIDTINLFYRINLEEDKEGAMRSFTRQMANLQIAVREKDFHAIVVEQVYTDKNGDIKPFTNRDTEHMVKATVRLEKIGIGRRQATIIKHRSQPEEKKAIFKITAKGLE
ncbi:MAG: DNA repair and recombination protein RadB, partial [Candidatus Thermoplasmatota archaeon]|nr:DNA repair and recombination protein RadB [Candidatus Thermoplasmatota archaeon]